MRRAHHPCRRRQRFRHLGHRGLLEHRQDVGRRSHRRYRHLVHRRNLDEQLRRRNHLDGLGRQFLRDAGHLDDLARPHLPDVDHLGDLRHPGLVDPCPAMERTDYCLGGPLGVEYPYPVTRRTGCFQGVECPALTLAQEAY